MSSFIIQDDPSIVVSADVTWDELSFTYQDGAKHWDAEKHMDVADEGALEITKKNITVTNHSNTSIKASFEFAADVEGLNGSFDKTEFDLASAENTTTENAPTDTTAFGISGGAITKDQKIGTITVKITSDTSNSSDTTMVKNLEDLRSVFENGGKAKLKSDLNGKNERLTLSSGKELELDLNRKTLSVDNCTLDELRDNNNNDHSDVTLRDCVITSDCFTSYSGIWKFEGVNNITRTMKVKKMSPFSATLR